MKKITQEFLTFGDIKIKKIKFYCSKELINLIDVDIEKLLMSSKCVYGKKNERNGRKYFIGCKTVNKN